MIVIRDAVKEDCKALLQLIIELVDYHDMLKNFKITLKMLEENGFGSDATFQCKIAFDDDKPIGHCLYYYGYSSFKGKNCIGKLLWKSVCKTALEKGCSSCNFMVDKNNDAAVRFYKFSGAIDKSDVEGWNIFQLSEKGMKEFVNN
ncbi:speG [Lepeophtheirus salmonis]|uniref:SpeG n=1 Tax=Lepeophtheirus salmonis TaxID=72036 RepID=A0A7R8CUC6_LEPSM|nr:speG [Lepeophtheirus salmonis]CAF2898962.1 speG [Lepeophtheirus salmonis]